MTSMLRRLRVPHLFLLVSLLLFLSPPIRAQLLGLMAPLTSVIGRTLGGTLELGRFVYQLPAIWEERERLEAELAKLRANAEEGRQLEIEVTSLRNLLLLPPVEKSRERAVGEIIGGLPGSLGSRLLVRISNPSRIQPNQAVLSNGQAFGRVIKAQGELLTVEPLNLSREIRAVTIGKQGVAGLLESRGGILSVEDIDPSATIAEGDEVRIAAQDEVFAPGTLIGHVKRTELLPGALARQAVVTSGAVLREVRFVEFIL